MAMRRLRKRYGRAARPIPKHLLVLARDVVGDILARGVHATPFSVGQKFGLPVEMARAIIDLAPHALAPGEGPGSEWMIKKAARIIGRKT